MLAKPIRKKTFNIYRSSKADLQENNKKSIHLAKLLNLDLDESLQKVYKDEIYKKESLLIDEEFNKLFV
jgi:hypothetical protein